MSKSRRQLSFVQTSENTTKRGNECALCHAPHTPLSALMSWRMLKPRSWHSKTSILHTSVLYVGCVVTTLAGWSKTQTSNLGGKREREGQIVASLCVAILHLHCQKLPLVSKYHTYFNVKMYHFVYETLQPKYTHCCTCN